MKNVLIISGHTDLNNSVANKTIMEELEKKIHEAEIVYLDKLYSSDFKIDVVREQERLLKADTIVLQFPIFWYAMPSLMSRWIEETFLYGFSHGETGDKLKGKSLIASFTTGAPENLYHKEAIMGYEIEEFLNPIKATCNLCGMEFAGYVYTDAVSYQSRKDIGKIIETKEKAKSHANKVFELVKKL